MDAGTGANQRRHQQPPDRPGGLGGFDDARAVVHYAFTFWNSSSSSRLRLFSFFGTSMRTRATTSPLPPPFSFGAPRPLIRSSLPSSEPEGIFNETAPSGVGTSTLPPSAAVGKLTGTSTSRSASPRRWYSGEGATRVTT